MEESGVCGHRLFCSGLGESDRTASGYPVDSGGRYGDLDEKLDDLILIEVII